MGPLRFCWIERADDDAGVEAKGAPEVAASAGTDGRASVRVDLRDAAGDATVSVLFTVPKKVFKRAWKRNLIKRRMRESYRQRKHELAAVALSLGRRIDIALVCMPEGAGRDKAKAAKTAAGNASSKAPRVAAATKKSGAKRPQEAPLPDFKTIDNAIEKILDRIAAQLRR